MLTKEVVCLNQLLKMEFYVIYFTFLECSHRNLLQDKAFNMTAMFPETDCTKMVTLCLLYKLELLIVHRLLKMNILWFDLINNDIGYFCCFSHYGFPRVKLDSERNGVQSQSWLFVPHPESCTKVYLCRLFI